MGGSLVLPFDHMLEFQNGKIELYGCFRICRLKVIFQNFGDDFSTLLHESIGDVGNLGV